jgi:hypothetical protein
MSDEKKIHEALGYLMRTCGYGLSKGTTEAFFADLTEAIEKRRLGARAEES